MLHAHRAGTARRDGPSVNRRICPIPSTYDHRLRGDVDPVAWTGGSSFSSGLGSGVSSGSLSGSGSSIGSGFHVGAGMGTSRFGSGSLGCCIEMISVQLAQLVGAAMVPDRILNCCDRCEVGIAHAGGRNEALGAALCRSFGTGPIFESLSSAAIGRTVMKDKAGRSRQQIAAGRHRRSAGATAGGHDRLAVQPGSRTGAPLSLGGLAPPLISDERRSGTTQLAGRGYSRVRCVAR